MISGKSGVDMSIPVHPVATPLTKSVLFDIKKIKTVYKNNKIINLKIIRKNEPDQNKTSKMTAFLSQRELNNN